MRKEADDTGPLAELEHWRLLMARFNSILDQVKSKHCKMVISTLNAAKSKVLKVTNQMVTACKHFITNNGMDRIWDQPCAPLIGKLKASMQLYKEYQKSFQKTKKKIDEIPGERPFEFSEMYIFGKFEAFCKRCEKIIDVVNTIEMFSVLTTTRIEGIDPLANKFQVIYANIKKKPYDILDHRKIDFDMDYDEFKKSVYDLECMLQGFLDSCFSKISSSVQALTLLRRFERLNISHLNIEEKYAVILHHFGFELETIRKLYQKNKEDPPVPRDMPPVSGKISWARQLFRRIQQPMDVIKVEVNIMKSPEAKRIIRNYNRMASVLMEFELLYHRAWVKQVDVVKTGLQASLLVRHPETNVLLVNFDPMLLQVIREAECMHKLELEVPSAANVICLSQEKLRNNCDMLKVMGIDYKKSRSQV
ncbi:dynein heavy chain 5, axonemal-like [Anneissia japonica]|uniref:dynein heavy chain 5, axonemal-like n=1 Tax=Anneissia japonica TaxID=1529436 RepID=UPI001425969D|nr:dynein heavy chain 5, axonemal-like [Anneissia japonica]